MIKVKDLTGVELRGVFRSTNGSLVIKNDDLLQKYLIERKAREKDQLKINSLESEVAELKAMLETVLSKLK